GWSDSCRATNATTSATGRDSPTTSSIRVAVTPADVRDNTMCTGTSLADARDILPSDRVAYPSHCVVELGGRERQICVSDSLPQLGLGVVHAPELDVSPDLLDQTVHLLG